MLRVAACMTRQHRLLIKKFRTRKILCCNPIHSESFFWARGVGRWGWVGSKQLKKKKNQWEYITGAKLLETYSQEAFRSDRDGDNWSVTSYECT